MRYYNNDAREPKNPQTVEASDSSNPMVDAKDLLQEGQSSGFRVFGTGGTGDHSLGLGASAFGRTENLDGIVAWSSRDRGDLRQSNGETAPNDESINNMLAKGT